MPKINRKEKGMDEEESQAIIDFKKASNLLIEKADDLDADINSSPFDVDDIEASLNEIKEAIDNCFKQLSTVKHWCSLADEEDEPN